MAGVTIAPDEASRDRTGACIAPSCEHALVVEGGGMRGIFSAGVLDAFSDRGYCPFDRCWGVSAGATNLAAWLAGQRGRNYTVITDYSCRPQFIAFRRFITGGHWLDLDWLWDITIRELRLDLHRFAHQTIPLYVVATRVDNGEAVYIRATAANLEPLLKVSCAIPIVYRAFPRLDGMRLADGGVADAIPVLKAYAMGAREMTVILSRPKGYRKTGPKAPWLLRRLLKTHPPLAEAMIGRWTAYNRAIAFIENPPADCRLRVIAPPAHFAVGRLTTDRGRLDEGYAMGLAAGMAV